MCPNKFSTDLDEDDTFPTEETTHGKNGIDFGAAIRHDLFSQKNEFHLSIWSACHEAEADDKKKQKQQRLSDPRTVQAPN